MSKYFLMLLVAITAMSCSKKVEVKGNFAGGSPLERIEFIEASGVATLPLVNLGVDSKGSFSGSFEAPKDGMYLMTYAGKTAMLYLKGGQELNISGQAANFPNQFTITGDAKNNNDFLIEVQKFIQGYAPKINVGDLVTKKEPEFLKQADKIRADIEAGIDAAAKKTSADSEVVNFKKDELKASILGLMSQYEANHAMATQNPSYKVSKNFKDTETKLVGNEEKMLKTQPIYRNYLLGKLGQDFQTYAMAQTPDANPVQGEIFSKFLDTKKEVKQLTKDYLLAFVLTSGDIAPGMTQETKTKIAKLINEKIKDAQIKKDLENILFVITGPKTGDDFPKAKLLKQDGNTHNLTEAKAKPTLVTFYASWNPYIAEGTVPVLREVVNFYKSKVDFAFVNLDDTKEQFVKTSNAMMKGIPGINLYGEGGLNSQIAKDLGIYGFKLPSFVLIDKNGKVASRVFYNLGDPEIVTALDKISGLKAPTVQPEVQLQNDLLAPQAEAPKK